MLVGRIDHIRERAARVDAVQAHRLLRPVIIELDIAYPLVLSLQLLRCLVIYPDDIDACVLRRQLVCNFFPTIKFSW